MRIQAKRVKEEARIRVKREQEEAILRAEEARIRAERERDRANFESSIEKTAIADRRKVVDTNRKYHFETTFVIYYKNHTKEARTVWNGSQLYDMLLGKLEE